MTVQTLAMSNEARVSGPARRATHRVAAVEEQGVIGADGDDQQHAHEVQDA